MHEKQLNILVTGASGFLGKTVVKKLSTKNFVNHIYGLDIRNEIEDLKGIKNFTLFQDDIRNQNLGSEFENLKIDCIVHLASIVNTSQKSNREFEFEVDVNGTQNILDLAVKLKTVKQVIVTSSGAAYGYHKDNPEYLFETDPIRGNYEFPYSYHKRLVEEKIKKFNEDHPAIKTLVFRPGTILGKTVNNQITDLFKKPVLLGIAGSNSPFNFIWDEDVVEIICQGIELEKEGAFNLAGDGYLTFPQIANILNKTFVPIPEGFLKSSLFILKKFKLTQYGPEQTKFLACRPVLGNKALKNDFGYTPSKTSMECFLSYLKVQNIEHKGLS